ncbi:hypothetical protein VH13_04315 [Corynebacterium ulcerans]|uniref:3'-5' exoribonuclease n=3 Tax=Corynebacterium TaxID=1716 RepID=A0ABD7MQQ2_CORUL|nr:MULTISPECIES: polyadenylate-specific 3'-exoribonuclease AS [Corynebacterium]AEG82048.1 hypothetical protein CULC809_01516 [Corynebacterium ulcerans 809]AIU30822.1 Hypothetical protein Cul210931_1487 [Corynebacterium ulcerans]AIU33073.1 Hypothetical protein CulFRC11_1504 [Corynebacterium ramonii FRC0011]AKN77427.1 Hypothetical protein CulFRC58_1573 [Corynebacterium ulcerans FRC58]ESU57893.1 hypothetical protein D881_08900 [Corynebacterium ulcerans NCTC 12077]
MRYFYDTEFIEDGRSIELVSIGIVAEDGREYYAVSTDADHSKAGKWVRENVLNKLPNPSSELWKTNAQIREEIVEFLLSADSHPELWAWVGAYDHVVLAQLWGDMTGLPRKIPRFTHELKQYWEFAGQPVLPKAPDGNHDALVDARHNLQKFKVCAMRLPIDKKNRA